MRKALIGLLITVTAAAPMASAVAQSRDEREAARDQRQEQRSQRKAERSERREQRSEARPARNDAPQRAQAPSPVVRPGVERSYARNVAPQQGNWQGRGRDDNRGPVRYAQDDRGSRQYDRNRSNQYDRNRSNQLDRYRNRSRNGNNWSHSWRNDRRYNWQDYRRSHRSIFRPGRYYSPYRNHHYSRFSIGFNLAPLFYSSRYWISDPWYYRLPPAYPGTRWVRYYDDVLLVDTYSGEVIDVIYDFFW